MTPPQCNTREIIIVTMWQAKKLAPIKVWFVGRVYGMRRQFGICVIMLKWLYTYVFIYLCIHVVSCVFILEI